VVLGADLDRVAVVDRHVVERDVEGLRLAGLGAGGAGELAAAAVCVRSLPKTDSGSSGLACAWAGAVMAAVSAAAPSTAAMVVPIRNVVPVYRGGV
jgi:hypothetical protein